MKRYIYIHLLVKWNLYFLFDNIHIGSHTDENTNDSCNNAKNKDNFLSLIMKKEDNNKTNTNVYYYYRRNKFEGYDKELRKKEEYLFRNHNNKENNNILKNNNKNKKDVVNIFQAKKENNKIINKIHCNDFVFLRNTCSCGLDLIAKEEENNYGNNDNDNPCKNNFIPNSEINNM